MSAMDPPTIRHDCVLVESHSSIESIQDDDAAELAGCSCASRAAASAIAFLVVGHKLQWAMDLFDCAPLTSP
jgi:hypothetical protein